MTASISRAGTGVSSTGGTPRFSLNFACRNRGVPPVEVAPFLLPLKHTAVNQNLKPLFAARIGSRIDEMLRAGDSPGSAKKLDVGQTFLRKFRFQKSNCRSEEARS